MMLIVAYIILVFTIIQLLVSLANLIFETNLPKKEDVSNALVSILIPARNEEKNIGILLNDLLNQDYNNIEVVVFNDQSEDKTAEIVTEYTIRDTRISMISSTGLPEGWLGKNFACNSLAGKANGRYLLFLDADVRIGNNAIGRVVSFSEKYDLALVSIFPKQIISSFGERITVPDMNYILVSLLPLVLVRKTKYPSLAAANGQFMFFGAAEYSSMKPHEKMKHEKVEDIAIARTFKDSGLKVACLLGDESISCRMYNGFSEAVNGFSKNVIAFFGNSFIIALLFWLITTLGFLPILFELPPITFAVYLLVYLSARIIISLASRQSVFYNILFIIPLQVSLFLFIYNAFINKYFRKFKWKGRNIN